MRPTVFSAGLLSLLLTTGACTLSPPSPSGSSAPPSASGAARPSFPYRDPSPEARPSTTMLPPGTPALPAIPAVRDFQPAPGQGWWPRKGTVVVTSSAGQQALAEEARLFAGELDAETDDLSLAETVPGDVVLRIDPSRPEESYLLDTRDGRLTITGGSDAGVFYGTRTAVQAIKARGYVPSGVAEDAPDRPQRGLMVDIARKHYSRDWLMARVKEMAELKLNQLHLHLSDDQGFRVESGSHPEVVSGRHLSKRDVADIVALAEERHVTVIPEIDSPGHLGAVLRAHPGLRLRTASGRTVQGAVDISKPGAARILDDLVTEYAKLFPGPYWHLGGDEYLALRHSDPERSFPQLAAYARERLGQGATVRDAATAWLNDRAATARKLGKRVKAWNDGFFSSSRIVPHDDREVEYWTGREAGQRTPESFLKEGRTLVNLNDEYLYYVLGEPNDFRYPTGERIYREWTPAVLRGSRPVPARLAGPDRVLGARLAVWGDRPRAQTEHEVASGIRMPLHALAQKVWHPGPPGQSWEAFVRLAERVR